MIRLGLTGFVVAMLGFSYALATSQGEGHVFPPPALTGRAAGTNPLRFTNPLVFSDSYGVKDCDLGDVALGSSLMRYAGATGGVRPYKFSAGTASPTLASALAGGSATLSVLPTGMLVGAMGNLTTAQSPVRFTLTATDSLGTQPNQVTSVFRLTPVDTSVFRFGAGSLCDGIQFQPYIDVVPVLNGLAPLTFSAGNVSLNGSPTRNGVLEDVGLSLGTSDGTVFGKPLVSGTLVFTLVCTDAQGHQAANRASTAAGQTVTLNIMANAVVASEMIPTAMTLKAGSAGNDWVKFTGVINLGGRTLAGLAGQPVQLRVAGYTTPNTGATPAVLNAKGQIAKPVQSNSAAAQTAPVLKGGITSKGVLTLAVSKDTLGPALGTLTQGQKSLAVSVAIGDLMASSQFLVFNVATSAGISVLTYNLNGTSDLGGEFMLLNVNGRDIGVHGLPLTVADAWNVSFLALPGGGQATFGSPDYAQIGIGAYTDPLLTVSESNGVLKSTNNTRTAKTANVTKLRMNAVTGKGSMTTGPLPAGATNITTAVTAGNTPANVFALNVTLLRNNVPTQAGEAALPIFANKNGWSSNVAK